MGMENNQTIPGLLRDANLISTMQLGRQSAAASCMVIPTLFPQHCVRFAVEITGHV